MSKYDIRNGDYVLLNDNDEIKDSMNEVVLVFVIHHGNFVVLQKHGNPKRFKKYIEDHAKVRIPDTELSVVRGRFPLHELNKLTNNLSYASKFYEKVMDGKMLEEVTHA